MGKFGGRAKGAGSPLEEVATVYPIHHASVVERWLDKLNRYACA
jgi:hypothetical protein